MRKCIVLIAGILFIILAISKENFAAEKVAYVDLKKVFDSYDKTKKFDDILEKKGKKYKDELEKKVQEIKKMQQSLGVLDDKQKEKKQREIDKKMQSLREFDLKNQQDLRKETDSKMQLILKDIDDVIQKFAKDEGYNIIFDMRFLIYSDKSLDITDKIVELLKKKK